MTKQLALPLTVLVLFTAVSFWLVAGESPIGFLTLAREKPWGAQVLLDLAIALSLFVGFMRKDARARGLPFLPYLLLTMLLGSIGPLAYLVHRALAEKKAGAPDPTAANTEVAELG